MKRSHQVTMTCFTAHISLKNIANCVVTYTTEIYIYIFYFNFEMFLHQNPPSSYIIFVSCDRHVTATLCMWHASYEERWGQTGQSIRSVLVNAVRPRQIEQHILVCRRSVERSERQIEYSHTQHIDLLLGDLKDLLKTKSHDNTFIFAFWGACRMVQSNTAFLGVVAVQPLIAMQKVEKKLLKCFLNRSNEEIDQIWLSTELLEWLTQI